MDWDKVRPESNLLDEDMKAQLRELFQKLEREVTLYAVLEDNDKCSEMAAFLKSLETLSDKLRVTLADKGGELRPEVREKTRYLPLTMLYDSEQQYTGAAFHGVPGGREMNSFAIAIYNAAGPGQKVTWGQRRKIDKISEPVNVKICVSLSCHHCPQVVAAAQRTATLNRNIEAEMIDAGLYPDLVEQYHIERVPMMIINDEKIIMGNKSLDEIIQILEKA